MKSSARQSMAWLHSWIGLLLGWFLFTIFLTGSLTYYRHEINLWSQPQLANIQVKQEVAVNSALNYLEKNASNAKSWYLQIANENNPVNKIFWQTQDGQFNSKVLDPNTAKELEVSNNQAGEFLYLFHFQLYGMPILLARTIVSFAAFIMLISLISGIITHKKIFTDFFTLRAFKGQRSYLDVHNVSSVIALPFFLTITFTGLAILFYLYFPLGIQKTYPENNFQFFEEIRNVKTIENPSFQTEKMLSSIQMQNLVRKNMGDVSLNIITIKNPNTSEAIATFSALEDHTITQNVAQTTFNAVTGEIRPSIKNQSAVAKLSAGVYGIHMMTFAQPFLRIALFISGILGCVMIASGLLLWSLKRQIQKHTQTFHFGHYLVNRLNITALIGLGISILSFLLTYRLNSIFKPICTETFVFFSAWLVSFILSLFIAKQYLWKIFLKIFIVLGFTLIIVDAIYISEFLVKTAHFSYWKIVRIDISILMFILFAIFLYKRIEPIKFKSHEKIKAKIAKDKANNGYTK